jgi:hypothetical protein
MIVESPTYVSPVCRSTPRFAMPDTTQRSMNSRAPCVNEMPWTPPWPFSVSPRSLTTMPLPAMSMPFSPVNTLIPAYTPGGEMIDTDCAIVTRP